MSQKVERIVIRITDGNRYAIVGIFAGGRRRTLDIKHYTHTAFIRAEEIADEAGGVEIVDEINTDSIDGPTAIPSGMDIVAAEIRLLSPTEAIERLVTLRQAVRDIQNSRLIPSPLSAKSDGLFTNDEIVILERLDEAMNGTADTGWLATIFDMMRLNRSMIGRLIWALERAVGRRPLRNPKGIIEQAKRIIDNSATDD